MMSRTSKVFHTLEKSWILTSSWKSSQVVAVAVAVEAFGLKEMPETEIPGHCPHPGMTRRYRNVQ